jgi:hypothetical protein
MRLIQSYGITSKSFGMAALLEVEEAEEAAAILESALRQGQD